MGTFIPKEQVSVSADNSEYAVRVLQVNEDGTALNTPAQSSDVAAVAAAITGTGLPIPLPLADAGNNEWSAPLEPNPITRACTRLFYIVGASGFQLSFDGGQTVHLTRPEDTSDDIAIAIPQGSDVRIRRLTAGTAIDGLIVEVR
ncbi:MAG: hypothetical protein GXY83_15655 [Rhodopirellula sp.]|mgnify:CR=1 FL=1|nr:hypothetical protein [Rhodopirellula sp.]